MNKPPIGILNKRTFDLIRLTNLSEAIERYRLALYPIPIEWIEEYNELINKYKK